jgi:EAL domain-containing protein (putative c-di-GMP-specific phosphodiesterase class I)
MSAVVSPVPAPLAELLASGGARAAYQSVVRLPGRRVVGYEALARGPRGSALEMPGALFGAAAREDLVGELDWACRIAALRGALDAGLPRSVALLVNAEPDVLTARIPAGDAPLVLRAEQELTLVAEITERRLADHPAELRGAARGLMIRIAGTGS